MFINTQRISLASWMVAGLLGLAQVGCGDDTQGGGGAAVAGQAGAGAGGAGGAGGAAGGAGGAGEAGAAGQAGQAAGEGGQGGQGGMAPASVPLGLNDVSVLYPLPNNFKDTSHLRPTDVGARGELLPQDVFDAIPTFPVTPADALNYPRMRVISMRFDGCGGLPDQCVPQVRLVMQPVQNDGSLRDSALHLFYRLESDEMQQLVDGLRGLRELAPEAPVEAPLDVHPALVAQGIKGAYGTALRELVLAHIGEQNLVRVTFFLRAPPVNEVWFMGGFERVEGKMSAIDVVDTGTSPQRIVLTKTETATDTTYAYDLTPLGKAPEDGGALYSTAAADAATEDERKAAMASFLRVENPSVYVPDHLPCAGCHISTFVTAEASRRFGLDPATFVERYAAPGLDLSMRGGAATSPSSLRAFGYFGADPMIAQRTINESAAVVLDLEARYPQKPAP